MSAKRASVEIHPHALVLVISADDRRVPTEK
jgi:hypothetical protein